MTEKLKLTKEERQQRVTRLMNTVGYVAGDFEFTWAVEAYKGLDYADATITFLNECCDRDTINLEALSNEIVRLREALQLVIDEAADADVDAMDSIARMTKIANTALGDTQ